MDKKNVSWEGEEYVAHDKNMGWYVGLIFVGLLLAALGVWLQQWTFVALIAVSVVALIVYSIRPPRKIKYSLTNKGLKEDNKVHNFEDFRAFGVLNDDGHFAIVLIPRKRFSPRLLAYFPEEQGEQIVDGFGARLPMEPVKLDTIDQIVRILRI